MLSSLSTPTPHQTATLDFSEANPRFYSIFYSYIFQHEFLKGKDLEKYILHTITLS